MIKETDLIIEKSRKGAKVFRAYFLGGRFQSIKTPVATAFSLKDVVHQAFEKINNTDPHAVPVGKIPQFYDEFLEFYKP